MSARKLGYVITVVVIASAALLVGAGTSSALDFDGTHIGRDGVGSDLTDLGKLISQRDLQLP
jgi:hypothetical protein